MPVQDRAATTKTDEPASSVPPRWPTLRLLFSGSAGILSRPARVLPSSGLTLGRQTEGDPELSLYADTRASRRHARIRMEPASHGALEGSSAVVIEDLGSKNGTLVNGRRITSRRVRDGDVLRVGDSILMLRFATAHQPDARVREILGDAPAVCTLRAELELAAKSPHPILLLGESGTGKEVAAQALQRMIVADGRDGPLVPVNCAAIPESLADSQLFGHAAGAFSGARNAQEGYFRAADGGTLFLDEVGELPLGLQAKMLRVLEEGRVTPVGKTQPISVDVRVIAATNRNLQQARTQGLFRPDLFARLSAQPIRLPPLRSRREDVLTLLSHHFGGQPRLTARLAEALVLHPWPLNIRELVQLARYLKLAGTRGILFDLPLVLDRLEDAKADEPDDEERVPQSENVALPASPGASAAATPNKSLPLPAAAKELPIPREVLQRMLEEHQGVIARIAVAVGRSRRQIKRWLERYGLSVEPFRRRKKG